jgi:hypothetical protein
VGWPARVYSLGGHGYGLGPRYCCPSATYAHASGGLGSIGFFCMHIMNLCLPLPTKVDHSQIASCCQCIWPSWLPFSHHFSCIFSILIMATSELHCLSQFLKRCQPPFFMETSDSYNHYNYKRGIRSTTLSKGGGMESRWIGSCRHQPSHHQSGLRCTNIPSLLRLTTLNR